MEKHFDIGKKCFGMYLGTVVQHLTHGMLKVYIQGIYPEEYASRPEMLPICQQVTPQFAGSHNGNGTFSYPNLGSTVVCFFANGDQNLPLTIGSILGGPNAFGQYEHIKTNDEVSSTRHLITAGKSHYEMYESGKISAVVVDPIRTQAEVQYGNSVDAPLSVDAVSSRPICEKVDNNEMSSINCQHVLDNSSGHGAISSTTHWFDPTSYSEEIDLSAENKKISIKKTGTISTDSYCVVDNDGHREFGQLSSVKGQFINTEVTSGNIKNSLVALTADAANSFMHNIDGTYCISSSYSGVDSSSYNDNSSGEVSNKNIKMKASSACGFARDASFCLSGTIDQNGVQTSGGTQKFSKNFKIKNTSSLYADGQNNITMTALSSSRMTEDNQDLKMQRQNKHNALATFAQSSHNGFKLDADWNDDDLQSVNGTTVQEKNNNYSHADFITGKKPKLSMTSQRKTIKVINGATEKHDVVCENTLSPIDEKVVVSITDNVTNMGCSIEMDSKGNMTIHATTSISIDAPTITVTGQSMTQTFTTFSQSATTMMVTGTNGDCKIKNVSLLNHKHYETQAGDVVSPQPTKNATQSN